MNNTKEIIVTVLVLVMCSVGLASVVNTRAGDRVEAETITPQPERMFVRSNTVGSEIMGLVR